MLSFLSRVGSLRRNISTVTLPSGEKVSFSSIDPYWARYLWAGLPYEPDVEMILSRLGRLDDKLLVDCGANIGYWTARSKAFGYGRVIAVEANPALLPLLSKNIDQNDISREIIHAAIHEKSGQTVYLEQTEDHGAAHVGTSGVPVLTTTLADVLKKTRERHIVIKLDIEGSEVPAMKGAPARDLIYVYEDWPRSGMPVTKYVLERGMRVIGMAPEGKIQDIGSVEAAMAFNSATRTVYGPSNLVALSPQAEEPLHLLAG